LFVGERPPPFTRVDARENRTGELGDLEAIRERLRREYLYAG